MNPQYMNQGPPPGGYGQGPYGAPQGFGSPGPMGQRPMGSGMMPPTSVQNGPSGAGPPTRPMGPPGPGNYAGPQGMKPSVTNGPQMNPAHPGPFGNPAASMNGPSSGPPAHQMAAMNIGGPPRGMPNNAGPPGPPSNFGPPNSNSIGQMPPRPGMPPHPSSMPGPPSSVPNMMPPATSAGGPQGAFPGMPPPPNSMGGMPQTSMGGMHPTSMGGMHPTSMGGMHPTSMGGMPQTTIGGMPPPPTSMGGMPTSMGGMPPQNAMGGMPPQNAMGGMPPQPTSMGAPPTSMGGVPPQSMGGMLPPPTSMGGAGAPPPGSMGGHEGQVSDMPPGMRPSSMSGMRPAPGAMPGQPPQPVPQMGMQVGSTTPTPMMQGGTYPGQQPAYNQMPGGPVPGQPQQPRRLDPDQMPSPIQVIEDDKKNRSGVYQTNTRGQVPPLVTTDYTCEDQGNSSPRYLRSTMYNIPCTADMLKHSHIPFILNLSPFARLKDTEVPPPIVDLGELGPVRCNRCKAYMNPYMQFIDGGRRFQCCFCGCATEVPPEYFNHLDHTGRRTDCYERPELCLGTYEFVATKDYCKNGQLPNPPAFIFMIDVSYNSVKSGLVHLICDRLKSDIIPNLPKEHGMEESEIRIGFVTYAKQLHFYNVKSNLAQPQMMVVSDVQDVFVPLLEGFLVKPSESESVIDSLLEQIPRMFGDSRETEIVLGPVIAAGLDALKAADCSGKLLIFHSSLPTFEAPGKLKNRDDRKLLGGENEKTILTPQNNYYTKLGQECVAAGCGVDLYLFPNSYIDIATISEVPRLTGGQVFKYTYFQADLDGDRLIEDLKSNLRKPIAFDAIMRVRTSTGIRAVDFLGNFYMSNTTDVELAVFDADKSVTIDVKHDDKLNEAEGAFIQAAILYTSVTGQRKLRIVNNSFNCCSQYADLFRNCELDTYVTYMAKHAIRGILNNNPKTVRENLMNQCAQILTCYRKNCASPSSVGQLILPECMKLLPLYMNCIIKSNLLQGGSDISTDDRSYLMNLVNGMAVKDTVAFFYPRLLPLHELNLETTALPTAIRCSYERLKETGVYLLDNGLILYLWLGIAVSPEWVQQVFGVQSAAQIDIDMTRLTELDTPLSNRVRDIISGIREERGRHMKLVIVRQRDKLEPVFQQYLMEDRSANGSISYVDFLCHIHKEIRNLLS